MKAELKKIICFSFVILLAGFNLQAQNVIKYFTDMPGYLLPSMESSHKLELIENYQKTGKDTLENLFGGKVRMLELDTVSQHISISTTSVSRFEMQILERSDKTKFIAIINTVCGPVCSSYIHFFDTEWQKIRMDFPELTNRQWIKSTDDTIDGVKLEDMLKGVFLEYNFNPQENSVEVKNNSNRILGKEEQELIEPFLMKKVVSVKWDAGKWMHQNEKLN